MKKLQQVMSMVLTLAICLTSTSQVGFAAEGGSKASSMIDRGSQEYDLKTDRSTIDQMKKGLYRVRAEFEVMPMEERKAKLIDVLELETPVHELEMKLNEKLSMGGITEEEWRLGQNYIEEFSNLSELVGTLENEDIVPFLEQMTHETEQAGIFAATGTAYFVAIFIVAPGLAFLAAIGTSIGCLFSSDC